MISDDSSVSISKHPTVTFNILGLPVLCLSKLYATCFFVKLTSCVALLGCHQYVQTMKIIII